jgi:hypothetical protein
MRPRRLRPGCDVGGLGGLGAAKTGQKTTTPPSNIGPREPGDMTGGSPAR